MNSLDEINFKELYNNTKKRLKFETKQIKTLSMYNYLNDTLTNVIIDCRDKNLIKIPKETKENSRLILILNDKGEIAKDKELEVVRQYIKNTDNLTKGIFHIFNTDYNNFIYKFPSLDSKNNNINNSHLPLCVLNDILYIGGFINSKNKNNLSILKIKCVVSLMKEDDKELSNAFGAHYRNFKHEEKNHDELEYMDIIDFIESEINSKNIPVLVYCFSGQTSSFAIATAFIMKYKKWPFELAIGYIMKLSPTINIPSWLYMQLQRVKFK